MSSVNQLISYKLITLLKRPVNHAALRHAFIFSSETLSLGDHYALHIRGIYAYRFGRHTHCGKQAHTVSPKLAAACGALGSTEEVNVSLESIEAFFSWLGVSEIIEPAACQRNVQLRKDKTIVRIVGGDQWDNVNRLEPLQLFIGQTCLKASADDDEQLDTEKFQVVGTRQSIWDCKKGMLAQPFTRTSGCTNFYSMTEDTIHSHDSIHITWTPLTTRRPPTTFPTDVLLSDLTVTLHTLLIVGDILVVCI